MGTLELARVGFKSLIVWDKGNDNKEFVCCSYYDGTKQIGSQWCWGHYFQSLDSAYKFWDKFSKEQ